MGLLNLTASQSNGGSSSSNSGYSISKNGSIGSSWSNTNGTAATAAAIESANNANSSALSSWREAAEFNAEQARIQREWQEYMSNTQYQRAVKDMIAAGINPILAAQNGISSASVGSGATASMTSPNTFMANTFADQNSASTSSSEGYGYSQNQGQSSSWEHSESGLGTALIQLGTMIKEAINNTHTGETIVNELENAASDVENFIQDTKDKYTPGKKGYVEINNATKQIEDLDYYLDFKKNHNSSYGGHKF